MQYGGSRCQKHRWTYSEGSGAGFCELHRDFVLTGEEFFAMLASVPGVERVEWHTSKTSQGNAGNHYMEHNILVTSRMGPGSASQQVEFELTWNNHMHNTTFSFTVTACFKEPTVSLIPEAWRILSEVVKGKELFPVHFGSYMADVLQTAQVFVVDFSFGIS